MKSIIREKAEKDPDFCPDCKICGKKTTKYGRFKWCCYQCRFRYDENLLKAIRYIPHPAIYLCKESGPSYRPPYVDNEFRLDIFWAISNKFKSN